MANQYQLILVLSNNNGEEGVNALIDTVKAKVETAATIDALDNLGSKKLAYEIKDQREGTYVKVVFTSESDFPKEIERILKITEGVLRYLIVRVSE